MQLRRLGVALAAVGAAVAAAAASGSAHAVPSARSVSAATSSSLAVRVLTPDGADRYDIGQYNGTISMSAPTSNKGGNLREVFWPAGQASYKDSQVCATWKDQSSPYVQQGVALRIVAGSTSTRALTVTKNIWGGAFWVFNVHTWDSSLAQPFTAIGQFSLDKVVWDTSTQKARPLPWRICAKVVGASLTFKVWLPDLEAEPRWTDATHAATTTVPSGYLGAGKTGWYVGHIPAGGSAHYNRLGIWQPPPS
jgi:hypothetical protein